jgi:hypothetical protein
MIFKRGDVYRNKESNVPCYIKENNGEYEYLLCWSYLTEDEGYVNYECWYTHGELWSELCKDYLEVVTSNEDKERLIYSWIPQHNFLSL